jgi:predicted RNase H-like HicB family nuclease
MTAREVIRLIESNGGVLLRQYHVVATRDGDGWMADVPALPGTHTWAKTLRALDRNVREVIGMVEDLPRSTEAAMDLEMEYHTGDPALDQRTERLRARRREQERAAAEIASDTSELLRRFATQLSVGDAAVLLGVSKGRISQLRGGSAGHSTAAARRTGTDG